VIVVGSRAGVEPPPFRTERITAFSNTNAITPIATPTAHRSTRRRPFGFFVDRFAALTRTPS